MIAWLGAKGLFGLARGLWILVILAVLGLLYLMAMGAFDRHTETARRSGAAEAVVRGQETTLKQIGEANEAGDDVRNDVGPARYCECMRSASVGTAGSCKRYLPIELVPRRPGDKGPRCP